MKKNGLKNRALVKTPYSYQPPQKDLNMNRSMTRSLNFPDHIRKQNNGQDKDTGAGFGKWIFFFIFSIWMFCLGVILGRQTAPLNFDINSIETELARLKAVEVVKEKEEIKTGIATLNEKSLDFYEDLRKGSSQILVSIPGKSNQPEIKRALSTKKNTEAIDPKNIVEPVSEAKTQARARPKQAEVQSNKDQASEKQKNKNQANNDKIDFAVQVASFAVLKDAETLAASLKKNGYSGVYHTKEDIPGVGTRYRVKVGFFKSKNDAKAVLKDLKNNEKLKDAYIFERKP